MYEFYNQMKVEKDFKKKVFQEQSLAKQWQIEINNILRHLFSYPVTVCSSWKAK